MNTATTSPQASGSSTGVLRKAPSWKVSRPPADWALSTASLVTSDIRYGKTALGHRVVKERCLPLTSRQRAALILVDGRRTLEEVLAATVNAGVTPEDLDLLATMGLIADLEPDETARAEAAAAVQAAAILEHKRRSPRERYLEAYPLATALTAALGLRGIRLNLAVEGARSYEQLAELAPRIREAVGAARCAPLEDALNDR